MKPYDVIILGAGASGLWCAIRAAGRGKRVALLDAAPAPGAKVRISGGGRCNFTNLGARASDYVCGNPHFVKSALARHPPQDFLAFLTGSGLGYLEEGGPGRLFCREGAKAVSLALENAAKSLGVAFFLNAPVAGLAREGDVWRADAGGKAFYAGKAVVALGGPAWPQAGATDMGLRIASSFDLPVRPARPGLVPLTATGPLLTMCRELTGVSLPVLLRGRGEAAGELLFTHRGVSGPAVLQASLFWRRGDELAIDFLPGADPLEALAAWPRLTVKNALARILPKRLAGILCDGAGLAGSVAETPKKRLRELAARISAFPFAPSGTEGFKKAETTIGGVDVTGISSKTMEAKTVPGLYFTGEVLDVAGSLGGFNLQWAWSSGAAAGEDI